MRADRRTLLVAGAAMVAMPRIAAASATETLPVWPGPPPGGSGLTVRDEFVARSPTGSPDDIAWPHVATPMLTVTPPAKPNGAAVLLIPGGGYARIALLRGGSNEARQFAARGITAFDLRYRLPHDGWAAGANAPLQDAQRAMRLIRAQAARWHIDPARVGAVGFSAGGHLAARLGSRAALTTYTPIDTIDRQSARPLILGLFFPVISLLEPIAHPQSRRELLGEHPDEDRARALSADSGLPPDMPPTYVACAANDPAVPPVNSIAMFSALQAMGIPSELTIWERGGHGFPSPEPDGTQAAWVDAFLRFASRHGL
ncbi:MAG: alpha/beta hydrolase [Croceibacterium sp.]